MVRAAPCKTAVPLVPVLSRRDHVKYLKSLTMTFNVFVIYTVTVMSYQDQYEILICILNAELFFTAQNFFKIN